MKQNTNTSNLQQLLKFYHKEPIGWILVDRLNIPIGVIWFLLLFYNYSYLAAQYDRSRNVLAVLPDFISSLNLFLVVFELIGKPVIFGMLFFYRNSIPYQLIQLEQGDLISLKSQDNFFQRVFYTSSNDKVQVIIIVISILYGILSAVVNTSQNVSFIFWPISFLGGYAQVVVLTQVVYAIVIVANCDFNLKLQINHPDQCSGLAPFGNLAILGYAFFFIWAMMRGASTAIGGGKLERLIQGTIGFNTLYLWILFPLAVIVIFHFLVYKPHYYLKSIQKEYLTATSQKWMQYYQQLVSNISVTASQRLQEQIVGESPTHFEDDFSILEIWQKLNQQIVKLHTWPIPKQTLGTIALLANPLLPFFLPSLIDLAFGWFS